MSKENDYLSLVDALLLFEHEIVVADLVGDTILAFWKAGVKPYICADAVYDDLITLCARWRIRTQGKHVEAGADTSRDSTEAVALCVSTESEKATG